MLVGVDEWGKLNFFSLSQRESLIQSDTLFKKLTIWPLYNDQILILKDALTDSLQKLDNPYSRTTRDKIFLENKLLPEENRTHFIYKIFKKKKIEHEK